jgi:phytoene dehydrogenase-like protein
MAPARKTGLIVSFLFDYKLTRQIEIQGWYTEFIDLCEQTIIQVLGRTIFPGLEPSIQHVFSSTPITMKKLTGNLEGAITGWAFSNNPVPTENRLIKILDSVKTPIPGVYQVGQWTFSPSGFPVSLLTGKVAADRVIKDLKQNWLILNSLFNEFFR